MLSKEELAESLCEYCPLTDFGLARVNNGPWNLCEGYHCDVAYKNYVDNCEDDEDDCANALEEEGYV